jgi:uncharacterized membrane protein
MSNVERIDAFEGSVEEKLEPVLKPVEHMLDETAAAMPAKARSILGGDWLGHPLHPMLTDLPIGFWTSSFLLDFAGKKAAKTSTVMCGLGVASALPTIAAGVTEFPKQPEAKKHTTAVHMLCNAVATLLYTLSFAARMKKMRGRGVLFGLLGAAVATAGGYLGGKLAYETADTSDASSGASAL